ncbi:hypothetical protein [Bacillus cereus group sp. N21]|uniref:hypothetical protein n=1 Tax=Bacillus cereus group sp. N21 TaxID=2794591 RepID=UPI0018F555B2|nr:hypothetical protein [Bacillus cereus group sp. N21]MBJ8031972.1 hypothetical protein [Bacillus cereus group sp. N21]
MKKVLSVMGSLVLSLGALFGFSGSASADTNSFSFATELDYMDDNKIRGSVAKFSKPRYILGK